MADQKPRSAKRRKSGDSSATEGITLPQPAPPRYYSSPPPQQMAYSAQYPQQEMYAFPHHQQQYPYRASPPGYPRVPSGQTFPGAAHQQQFIQPQNPQYITPDTRQVASLITAFGSPSSILTRQPVASAHGSTKTPSSKKLSQSGKFIYFLDLVI